MHAVQVFEGGGFPHDVKKDQIWFVTFVGSDGFDYVAYFEPEYTGGIHFDRFKSIGYSERRYLFDWNKVKELEDLIQKRRADKHAYSSKWTSVRINRL